MKCSPSVLSFSLGVLLAASLTGCYPTAQRFFPKVQRGDLTIKGQLVAEGRPVYMVSLYIEQETEADAFTENDGSFQLFFTPPRIEALTKKYDLTKRPTYLSFEDENNRMLVPAGAMREIPDIRAQGILDLGVIELLPLTTLSGQVLGNQKPETNWAPVKGAEIRIGRRKAETDSNGTFQILAPQKANVPLWLSAQGFVETHGLWPTQQGPDGKTLPLFEHLAVDGRLEVPNGFRQLDPTEKQVDLLVAASPLAHSVRIAADPSAFASPDSGIAPWQDLHYKITLPVFGVQANFVYQFADRERKVLSPVYELNLGPSQGLDNGNLTNEAGAQ